LTEFTWKDGERLIVFRHGALANAPALLRESGWEEFERLSTSRALSDSPGELTSATPIHEVPSGAVPRISHELLTDVQGTTLVALGGGRVIDTAKAIAAVREGRVCAIPTTLSGAPMTSIHRLPEGEDAPARVRPALVLADPDAMTTQPEDRLRASAMNALAHGADSLYTPLANPVTEMAALRGARLLAGALDEPRAERDRGALALGAILCAYSVGSAGFALHHVLGQSIVRACATPHAETYAALLPRTMEAMRDRAPAAIAALADALGASPERIGERIEALRGGRRTLADLGADPDRRAEVVALAVERSQLANTPDPPEADELETILDAAW
jgi:alcohol dehydrogenase class IV